MKDTSRRLGLDQPATYQIRVQGELDEDWVDRFDNMTITAKGGITTLTGTVADQPALHGLLIGIRDLGLPLLSVRRVEIEE
jgi:hypothetical protein